MGNVVRLALGDEDALGEPLELGEVVVVGDGDVIDDTVPLGLRLADRLNVPLELGDVVTVGDGDRVGETVPLGPTLFVGLRVPLELDVPEPEAKGESELVVLGEAVLLGMLVRDAAGDDVTKPDGVGDGDVLGVALADAETLRLPLAETLAVISGEDEGVGEVVSDIVNESVDEAVREIVADALELTVWLSVPLELGVVDSVGKGVRVMVIDGGDVCDDKSERVPLALGVGVTEGEIEGDDEVVRLGLSVPDALRVPLALGVVVTEGEIEGDDEVVRLGLSVPDALRVPLALGVGVTEGEIEGDDEDVRLGLSVPDMLSDPLSVGEFEDDWDTVPEGDTVIDGDAVALLLEVAMGEGDRDADVDTVLEGDVVALLLGVAVGVRDVREEPVALGLGESVAPGVRDVLGDLEAAIVPVLVRVTRAEGDLGGVDVGVGDASAEREGKVEVDAVLVAVADGVAVEDAVLESVGGGPAQTWALFAHTYVGELQAQRDWPVSENVT